MDYPDVDPSAGDYNDQLQTQGWGHSMSDDVVNGLDIYNAETGGLFSWVSNAAKNIGGAIGSAAKGVAKGVTSVANVVQKGVGALTNNPLWDIARTGVSFIPGVGTAVSAGMAGAAAIGRGDSLKDIGLAAAKGAIPGGPAAQAAFDVALGLAKGQNVTDTILAAAKSQVPGGDLGKAAFDAATAIAKGKAFDTVALETLRSQLPGGVAAKAAFDVAINKFKEGKGQPMNGATRAFGALGMMPNRVASAMIARPELMRAPASNIASELNTSIENVQKAFTAFMGKWSGAQPRIHWSDVGSADSLESWCEREAIPMQSTSAYDDAGFQEGDTGSIFDTTQNIMRSVMSRAPRLQVSKPYVQALYTHGHNGIKQGILAHGLMARLHHQTGELDGAGGWIIKSGETPSGIAQKMTGTGARWQELLAVNPKLKVVNVGSTTQIQPFNPGQRLTLPTSWLGTAAPAPQPTNTQPGAAPTSGAQPTIKQGSTGATVSAWQNLLLRLGSKLVGTADGIFGPQTAAATKAYQSARGLTPDGIVGPMTWGVAMKELATSGGGPPPVVIQPPVITPPIGIPPIVLPPTLPPMPPGLPPIIVSTPTSSPPPPIVVGPSVPSSSTDVAIGAIETALAYFFQKHADATFLAGSPAYGLDPADHSGTWDPRDKTAMLGFQSWANKNGQIVGFPLPVTGEPDTLSVKALQAVTAADLSRDSGTNIPPPSVPTSKPPPGKPPILTAGMGDDSGFLLLALGGAALLLGSQGRRAA